MRPNFQMLAARKNKQLNKLLGYSWRSMVFYKLTKDATGPLQITNPFPVIRQLGSVEILRNV